MKELQSKSELVLPKTPWWVRPILGPLLFLFGVKICLLLFHAVQDQSIGGMVGGAIAALLFGVLPGLLGLLLVLSRKELRLSFAEHRYFRRWGYFWTRALEGGFDDFERLSLERFAGGDGDGFTTRWQINLSWKDAKVQPFLLLQCNSREEALENAEYLAEKLGARLEDQTATDQCGNHSREPSVVAPVPGSSRLSVSSHAGGLHIVLRQRPLSWRAIVLTVLLLTVLWFAWEIDLVYSFVFAAVILTVLQQYFLANHVIATRKQVRLYRRMFGIEWRRRCIATERIQQIFLEPELPYDLVLGKMSHVVLATSSGPWIRFAMGAPEKDKEWVVEALKGIVRQGAAPEAVDSAESTGANRAVVDAVTTHRRGDYEKLLTVSPASEIRAEPGREKGAVLLHSWNPMADVPDGELSLSTRIVRKVAPVTLRLLRLMVILIALLFVAYCTVYLAMLWWGNGMPDGGPQSKVKTTLAVFVIGLVGVAVLGGFYWFLRWIGRQVEFHLGLRPLEGWRLELGPELWRSTRIRQGSETHEECNPRDIERMAVELPGQLVAYLGSRRLVLAVPLPPKAAERLGLALSAILGLP